MMSYLVITVTRIVGVRRSSVAINRHR